MLLAEPGKQTVLDRLLDVLVVLGLRAGLTRSPTAPPWFRAAADPRLAPALEAVHASAAQPWTYFAGSSPLLPMEQFSGRQPDDARLSRPRRAS